MTKLEQNFLRYRWLIMLFIIIDFIARNAFYRNLVESSNELCDKIKALFLKSEVVNNIFSNITLLISKDFCLLYGSFTSTLCFILLLIFTLNSISKFCSNQPATKHLNIFKFIALLSLSFIYLFFIKSCNLSISLILFTFSIIIYLIDFILFDYKNIYEAPILKRLFLVFFTIMIFVSEFLFLPIYIKFLNYSSPDKLNYRKLNIIRYAHFALMIFIATILISPINSPLIKQMDLLNSGIYYGTAYSEKEDKLFALNQGEQQLEVFSFKEQINKKVIYKSKLPKNNRWQIGHFINLNNDRNELYFTDREQNKLIILDTRDYSIKDTVQSEIFDYGDNFIDSANNDIFGITEENMCVYKISLMSKSHKMISKCFLDGEGSTLSLNKIKKQLYVFNWRTTTYKYSLYILDANDLNVIKKIPVPFAGHIQVSKDGQFLYHNVSNFINVLDADTFKSINDFQLPFTSNYAGFDTDRQLLFAGNFFTGIISIIDIKSRRTIQYQRCGNFYTRIITLDTKNRRFFVASYGKGICSGNY